MYQSIIAIKDRRFSIYQINKYYLLISIGNTQLKISCFDPVENRCLLMEVYQIKSSNSLEYLSALKELFQDHSFIAVSIWKKVCICFENQQYTLVPTSLFQEKNKEDYLKLAVSEIAQQTVKSCMHMNLGVTVVFAVDLNIVNWLQTGYKSENCVIIHQASSLIAGVTSYLQAKKLTVESKVFVWIETNYIHITVLKNSQLLYYNRFFYTSSDELLQYILIVMSSLKLNPNLQEVILTGNITKSSLAYKKVCNYIRYVSFSKNPSYFKFGWVFKKDVCMNYFDILNLYPATNYLNILKVS